MKRPGKKNLAIAIAVLGLLFLAYPMPDKAFLFRNIPELKGQTRGLMGSSTVLFLDPSFYYRFEMNEARFLQLMQQQGLEPVQADQYSYYQDTVFAMHRPFVWHNWWWQPIVNSHVWLFDGYRDGNNLTFLYLPEKRTVFLYIQNT